MVGSLDFLNRLGIPGSAVAVLSELTDGSKSTSEISSSSRMSKSAILVGVKYWMNYGVVKKCSTNKWELSDLKRVEEMKLLLQREKAQLKSLIARLDDLIN